MFILQYHFIPEVCCYCFEPNENMSRKKKDSRNDNRFFKNSRDLKVKRVCTLTEFDLIKHNGYFIHVILITSCHRI